MWMILEHPILAKKSPPVRKKISELEKSAFDKVAELFQRLS